VNTPCPEKEASGIKHKFKRFTIESLNKMLYKFCGAMMTIKGSLPMSVVIVKTFSGRNFVPSKICPKFPLFGEMWLK